VVLDSDKLSTYRTCIVAVVIIAIFWLHVRNILLFFTDSKVEISFASIGLCITKII